MLKVLATLTFAVGAATLVATKVSSQTLEERASRIAAVSLGGWGPESYLLGCILTTEGEVKCFGDNGNGQLGNGTKKSSWGVGTVTGLQSGVVAIATGLQHACALTTTGGMLCWGRNRDGELGNGATEDELTPAPVPGLESGVMAIAAGGHSTCALTRDGGVKCWGANQYGQVGDGTDDKKKLIPTQVLGLESGVSAIAVNGLRACAVMADGSMACWGSNALSQVVKGEELTNSRAPAIGIGNNVRGLALGGGHTCALTTDGEVYCWGANGAGQLGDSTKTRRPAPALVSGLPSNVTAVAAGLDHTCALTSNGETYCWGRNYLGQLLDGTTEMRLAPVKGRYGGFVTGLWLRDEMTCYKDPKALYCQGPGGRDLEARLLAAPSQAR